jgi:hypothetical protein
MTDKRIGFIWGIFAGIILTIVMIAFVAHLANTPDSTPPPDGGGVGGGPVYMPPENLISPLDVPPPAPMPSIAEPAQPAQAAPAQAEPQ